MAIVDKTPHQKFLKVKNEDNLSIEENYDILKAIKEGKEVTEKKFAA
jgi:hypothetical protein